MLRKLASIQSVSTIEPIEGADRIELIGVKGWQLVAKKGEFQINDKCVFFEVDSMLPVSNEHFKFLESKANSEGFARLRTAKFKKQISQGLALPMSILPPVKESVATRWPILRWLGFKDKQWEVDDDVTIGLGVEKYESDPWNGVKGGKAKLGGMAKGGLPPFVIRTDEERVQNLQWLITKYAGTLVSIVEKLDGSSMSVYLKDGEFGVCSRNLDLKRDETNAFWARAIEDEMEKKLEEVDNYVIQGELIGPGIQGNKYGLTKTEFRVFNVFNINTEQYLSFDGMHNFCLLYGFDECPLLATGTLSDSMSDLISMSVGYSKLNEKTIREGVVIRPLDYKFEHKIGRVSFKIINPNFSLKWE